MPSLCEACRCNPIAVADQPDAQQTAYSLCAACFHRLENLSLRPLEYFNLVALHGHDAPLHDDVYEEDGTACQPQEEVVEDPSLAFPTLASLAGNVARLVDYAFASWEYSLAVTPSLRAFDPALVLPVLAQKVRYNPALLPRCLDIAVHVLGPAAAAWVRDEFNVYAGSEPLLFTPALVACLPRAEAEALVLTELSKLSEKELRQQIRYLCYLEGQGPLDWMEAHCQTIQDVTDSFGLAAAVLGINWARVQRWLHHGRPLSLMALDALDKCRYRSPANHARHALRKQPAYLHEPAPLAEMDAVLTVYLAQDNVPRTREQIGVIQASWPQILKPDK